MSKKDFVPLLKESGFVEVKPNLWCKNRDDGIMIYTDFRRGYRFNYAFKGNESVDVKELKEYRRIKLFEVGLGNKKLGDFK